MQNEFITAIGLAEWEDDVVKLLEKYNVPEVDVDEDADQYLRFTEDHLIDFWFDNKKHIKLKRTFI